MKIFFLAFLLMCSLCNIFAYDNAIHTKLTNSFGNWLKYHG